MHLATRLGLSAAAAARRPAPSWPAAARRRCSGRPHLAEVETADATSDLGWLIDMVQFGAFVTIVNGYVLSMTQCIGPSMTMSGGASSTSASSASRMAAEKCLNKAKL